MAALHDMECDRCGTVVKNLPFHVEHSKHKCGGRMEILWLAPSNRDAAVHTSERAVVYKHPKTGKVIYPGRNDQPMPARYASQGFERHEMPSLRSLEQFGHANGVVPERAYYDKGSGNSYDNEQGRR